MDDVIPSELRAVLKLSLRSQDQIALAAQDLQDRPQLPIVKDLIDAILFSRRFVPSYLAVLAIAILLWTSFRSIRTWSLMGGRKKLLLEKNPSASTVSSSSSSTLLGSESSETPAHAGNEASPLLAQQVVPKGTWAFPASILWRRLRAMLLYQPKPIPSLSAAKNALPANDTSLVILIFFGVNMFYLFFRMPLSRTMVFAFADRAGLLFVVNLPVLYLFAAKNSQPFQYITNWSYEGLNIFHRRLGEWMTLAAVSHAAGMIIAFYDLIAPAGYTIWWYLTRRIIVLGCIAFGMYAAIYVTSTGYFRQALYEAFLVLHILLQVTALAVLFFHHHDARPYVLAAGAIWVLDRGVARIASKTRRFIATLEIAADKETILVFVDVPMNTRRALGLSGGWHPGQHLFLTVPDVSMKHRFQAHPFTIASPAPSKELVAKTWPLQLTIRAQDGFSRELLDYAKMHQHTGVLLDGPYSSSGVFEAVQRCNRLCLVAGGSGIAVTYPFAWSREIDPGQHGDIIQNRTMYRNGLKVIPDVQRLQGPVDQARFAHFWVRQDARHESWITILPCTDLAMICGNSEQAQTAGARYARDLVTHRFETRSATGQHQRPNIDVELKSWVRGDLKQNIGMQQSICVVVSGPDELVRDVQNSVASLVREGWNIDIHIEKFGW